MGSGASLPQKLDKDTVKLLSGIHFDEGEFESLQEDGLVTKEQYLSVVSKYHERINNKYCEVTEVFTNSLWEPLLRSSFYHILFDAENGAYAKYDTSSMEERRKLLLQSCYKSFIDLKSLFCEKSCQRSFTDGSVCNGTIGVSGSRLRRNDNGSDSNRGNSEGRTLWPDFDTSDPDDVAIHLWTYSMAGTRREKQSDGNEETRSIPDHAQKALYKRVNVALLQDDPEALANMAYIICGIVRWIRHRKYTPDDDVILYRGTPISKEQEHEVGHALTARLSGVSEETHAASANVCRMPLFIASSASLETAQQFTSIRSNGVACPILEFVLPKGQTCDSVACVEPLSHFPDEKEWLMCAYSAFEYRSQRLEYLEIGRHSQLKLVMIVQYTVLTHQSTFEKFEAAGQDIKTVMMLCKPPTFLKKHFLMEADQIDIMAKEMNAELQSEHHLERNFLRDKIRDEEDVDAIYLVEKQREFSENEVRRIIDDIQNADDKVYAMELLSALDEQIKCEREKNKKEIAKLHSLELENVKKTALVTNLSCECEDLQRKIDYIEREVDEVTSRLSCYHQLKAANYAAMGSISQNIRIREEKIVNLNQERDYVIAQIHEREQHMAPLLAEERAAFSRWESREKVKEASGIMSLLTWEEKLACVERAKREFIDAVFPPEEMQNLHDKVRDLTSKVDSTVDNITQLTQESAVLAAKCEELTKDIKKCDELLKSLEDNLKKEKAKHEELIVTLEDARREQMENCEEMRIIQSNLSRSPLELQKLWNKLGEDVSQLHKPLVSVTSLQMFDLLISKPTTVVVFFSASWSTPCFLLEPKLKRMARENPSIDVICVDVDKRSDLVSQVKVTVVPTIQIYKNSDLVETTVNPTANDAVEIIGKFVAESDTLTICCPE